MSRERTVNSRIQFCHSLWCQDIHQLCWKLFLQIIMLFFEMRNLVPRELIRVKVYFDKRLTLETLTLWIFVQRQFDPYQLIRCITSPLMQYKSFFTNWNLHSFFNVLTNKNKWQGRFQSHHDIKKSKWQIF